MNLLGFCTKKLIHVAAAVIIGLVCNTSYYDRGRRKGSWKI